jgi:hypothetical protein
MDELVRKFLPGVELGEDARRFSLEDGGKVLDRAFSSVEVVRYEDWLVITDADAVVAYVRSAAPNANASHLESLRQHIRGLIAGEGAFRVTKDTGMFVAVV